MSKVARIILAALSVGLCAVAGFALKEDPQNLAADVYVPGASASAPQAATAVPGVGAASRDGAAPASTHFRAPEAILFDNGTLVTHPGGGLGGADASALQTALGNGIYGFGHAITSGFRMADDFTVPAGGWNVSQITFFAYQTGSTTTSTINNVNLQIWNGPPGQAGSSVVFGDTATNRLSGSSFSNIYRTLDTALTDGARPIMADVVTVGTVLAPGTYWLDWQTGGTLASGPWAPPVTILGLTGKPGANGLQYDPAGGTWGPATDVVQQDLPFIVEGTTASGPSISLVKTVGTTAGVCAGTGAITVPAGTTVYYCYTVTNSGTVTFTTHDLADDQLGTIFTGTAYSLTPGNSVDTVTLGLSISAVINTTTTNIGTWTARDAAGAPTVATDSATVTAIPPRCPAGGTEITVLSQDFAGSFPPAGWVISNTTTACTGTPGWTNTDPGARGNLTGGAGLFAIADSDACGSGSVMNAQMWSPPFDLTGLTDAQVAYYTDYNDIGTGGDIADLDFSINGGGSWTNLLSWDADFRGPLLVEQPFAADNQANTVLRWNFINATWDWWWEVDDVVVTACQPAVCVLTPPADITVTAPVGATGATVNFTVGASAGCGAVTCVPPSGSFFPLGTTAVNCTSEFGGGTTSFNVTVLGQQSIIEIPTLAPAGLAGLTLLLAGAAIVLLRRRRA